MAVSRPRLQVALGIKRTVWRNKIGETKTEESAGSVPVIEPLRSLLEKLRQQSAGDYIMSNGNGKPLSLDSLNTRVIAPVLKTAGINWRATILDGGALARL